MNRAFELAFSTAYAFVGQMPCFLEVDHVDFLKPVSIQYFKVMTLLLLSSLQEIVSKIIISSSTSWFTMNTNFMYIYQYLPLLKKV